MKKFIVNVFATTGISLLLLSIIALCYKADCLYITTVLQTLGANLLVHLGLLILHRMEFQYPIVEMTVEVLVIMVTLIIFGTVFQWFTSTPVWMLILMSVMIYAVSLLLNLMNMKQETQKINALIKKRNKEQ